MQALNWIRYVIGYVFIVSGIVKLLVPEFKQIFLSLGLPFPETTLFLVAMFELVCGVFILASMYVKYATVPLIVIMTGAVSIVKFPLLLKQGLLSFVFESRLDVVMLILLIVLWQHSRQVN